MRPHSGVAAITRRLVTSLCSVGLIAVSMTVGATAGAAAPPTPPPTPPSARSGDQVVIVNLDQPSGVAATVTDAHGRGWAVRKAIPKARAVSLRVPAHRVDDVLAHYRGKDGVASVEVAVARTLTWTPNDPAYPTHQRTYLNAVTAPAAWNVQRGSSSVKIAVVDSGVDVGHPDLAGKVVGRYSAVNGGTNVTDQLGHGTFVAGVAAAATNNALGIAGAGYRSSVLAVKVDDGSGGIPLDYVIDGIVWAADHGAKVINCSFAGTYRSAAEGNAIAYAQSKGAVVVASAGNYGNTSNPVVYPAAYPQVLAVGATDAQGNRAYFSEYGNWVTLAAPGVNIYSTTPRAGSQFFNANYDHGAGTSFSAPLVSAEVALLAAQSPSASTAALRSAVINTAHGYLGLGLGAGQVDFLAGLTSFAPTTTPTLTRPLTGATDSGSVRLSARSEAAAVQFKVGSTLIGSPVRVVNGIATHDWPSYGSANGLRTVSAVDCTGVTGVCGSRWASVTFLLANAAPTMTSPKAGQAVTGTVTLQASAPGGGVAFVIDGVRRGFDGSAPYALPYDVGALPDGPHVVRARGCSANGVRCLGPTSLPIAFTSRSLHPSVRSLSPNPFSPNGDGRLDRTRFTYLLPQRSSATIEVRNAAGVLVRGPVALGTQSAGLHSWLWGGRSNSGTRVRDGVYTVRVSTSAMVGITLLRGSAGRTARLDTAAPTLSYVWGDGYRFYPYPDGYLDVFNPSATLNSPGTVRLLVRNSSGTVIRTVTAKKPPGRVTLTWNGRNAWAKQSRPGTYRWQFTVSDSASNVGKTASYLVTIG